MIVEKEHIALKDEMRFATRKCRMPYGLEQLEMKQEEKKLDAAGPLYVAITEYKKLDPATPSPLSVGTPGDTRSNLVENRFRDALEKERAESEEGERMDETLSEAGEEMEVGKTPEQDAAEKDFTMQELLQDLSGDDWANTATPPLGSPRKDLELPLTGETSNMGMSAEESKRNAFEGNKWMFLNTLDEKAWREFLSEFDQRVKSETTLEDFKEELWKKVVKFGETVSMRTGLDEKARMELLSKMIKLRGAFKGPLLTHCNAITTGWKRVGGVSRDNTKARKSILEEDLAKNVSLSLHYSFCLNRESKMKGLPNQAKRLQEQREWMRSYEQLKAWEEIVISSDDEKALLRQITVSNASGPSTSRARSTN